jgi:subtilisin family serine protease
MLGRLWKPLALPASAGLVVGLGWQTPPLTAQPPTPEVTELIVLIAAMPEAPEPEVLVDAVNGGGPIPGGFDVGDPLAARLAITRRAVGGTHDWMEANPDTPLARLERYVVLDYPDGTDLAAVAADLAENPYAENVEENVWLTLSGGGSPPLPSDPLIDPSSGDPEQHQWGPHTLNLPAAWQLAKGHAWVGVIDTGIEVQHPDLRTYSGTPDVDLVYHGGNFREHLSWDFRFEDCNVDEMGVEDGIDREFAGHGSHVSGIVAATTDNGMGVAGTCRHCSLLMARAFTHDDPEGGDPDFVQDQIDRAAAALLFLTEQGAQVVNFSFGASEPGCGGLPELDLDLHCQALALAEERDVVLTAAAGNHKTSIQFPANDSRVIAVGGIEFDPGNNDGYSFWDEAPDCPFPQNTLECGSNFGPEQDLAAPAKSILSTTYTTFSWNTFGPCGDDFFGLEGYGPCTGTSMSSPFVAGIAGIVRSTNPLLRKAEVRDVLIGTASQAGDHDDQLGYGVPDAAAAVRRVLGTAGGEGIVNRLTPLFSLYSSGAQTHVYTVFPSSVLAFLFDMFDPFETVGPAVPGYPTFDPGCTISPCLGAIPRASAYIFTTDAPPFPGAPELVPLYRLRYDPNLLHRCEEPPPDHIANRDFSYTTTPEGVVFFKENVTNQTTGQGYDLDGIEGYVYRSCEPEPECIPEGAVRLYRLYNATLDDYVIFPRSELETWQAAGYGSQSGLADWIGYVYPNVDGDGDDLIDGFELLLGTDPANADTDCDGVSDGAEVHTYDMADPDPALHGYGDPLDGPCVFSDGFERGDASRWSATQG